MNSAIANAQIFNCKIYRKNSAFIKNDTNNSEDSQSLNCDFSFLFA